MTQLPGISYFCWLLEITVIMKNAYKWLIKRHNYILLFDYLQTTHVSTQKVEVVLFNCCSLFFDKYARLVDFPCLTASFWSWTSWDADGLTGVKYLFSRRMKCLRSSLLFRFPEDLKIFCKKFLPKRFIDAFKLSFINKINRRLKFQPINAHLWN